MKYIVLKYHGGYISGIFKEESGPIVICTPSIKEAQKYNNISDCQHIMEYFHTETLEWCNVTDSLKLIRIEKENT